MDFRLFAKFGIVRARESTLSGGDQMSMQICLQPWAWLRTHSRDARSAIEGACRRSWPQGQVNAEGRAL